MAIKVFLGSGDSFTASNNNISIVGASGTGSETIVLQAGVTGVTTDANIERVDVSGNLADFKFIAVAGTGIQIQNAAGTVVATIPSLNQNATVAFTDGSATLVQTGGTAFTLGGQAVSTTTAAAITSASMGTGFNTAVKSGSGTSTGTGTTVTGQSFSLTNSATADVFSGGSGNDTITGAAGTFAANDVIVDSSTTDSDTISVTMNNYTSTQATVTNVENFNAVGAFASAGLDAQNVTGVKVLTISTGIDGGTGTLANATASKVAKVVAGSKVDTLNVNNPAAGYTNGTGTGITIDGGSASTINVGDDDNTGSDVYTITSVANATLALAGGSAGTDTFTLNLPAGAATLGITNKAAGTGDINVLNLVTGTTASTVTLNNSTNTVVGVSAGDGIVVSGSSSLTLKGDGDVLANIGGTGTRTATESLTKASGYTGTVDFQNNAGLSGAAFFNRMTGLDNLVLTTAATGANITVNEATTIKFDINNGSQTYDVDNNTATQIAAGGGTLKVALTGTNATNATQTSMTTGQGVGTLVITNSTIDSVITTLNTTATAATVDTVVVQGNKNLTVNTWTATANETFTASSMTGNLTLTVGANAGTVVGGSGNDVLTGGGAADKLSGGSGDDSINGGALADTLSGGAGNDRFTFANNATIDSVTDFSISGSNGADVLAYSVGSGAGTLSTAAIATGAGNAYIAGGNAVVVKHVAAATALAAGQNIFVIDGTFATAALLQTAIEVGGSRQLTFANATTAADDILVAWTDGAVGHFGWVNIGSAATTITAASATYTDIATLTGITDVTQLVAGNFLLLS